MSVGMGLHFVVRKIDVEVASCWQRSWARTIWNDECFVQKITGAGCCAAVCKWLCFFFQHHLCSDSQICDQKAERTEGPVDAASCSPSETCLFPPLSRSVPLTIKGDMEWNHVHLSMESAVLLHYYLLVYLWRHLYFYPVVEKFLLLVKSLKKQFSIPFNFILWFCCFNALRWMWGELRHILMCPWCLCLEE